VTDLAGPLIRSIRHACDAEVLLQRDNCWALDGLWAATPSLSLLPRRATTKDVYDMHSHTAPPPPASSPRLHSPPPNASLRRLIVSDLHGDWPNLRALLHAVGALDENNERVQGWWLAQVGDIVHGGTRTYHDTQCLTDVLRWFDLVVWGNHDLPHACPHATFPRFAGMGDLLPQTATLLEEAVADARFCAAGVVDEWLATHAGVHPTFQEELGWPETAAACAMVINDRFRARLAGGERAALFDAVGYARMGNHPHGGIFWQDWRHLVDSSEENRLHQIVGHTPRPNPPERAGGRLWCVDAGAAVSGKVSALLRPSADAA